MRKVKAGEYGVLISIGEDGVSLNTRNRESAMVDRRVDSRHCGFSRKLLSYSHFPTLAYMLTHT